MRKRYLFAFGIIAAIVLGIVYVLFIVDSPFNFYKKIKIKNYAKSYVEEHYTDFEIDNIDVNYDNAFNYYVASCYGEDKAIVLNYSSEMFMEFDNYYNDKYTSKAIEYQKKTEAQLSDALKAAGVPFSNVTVFVDLDSADKKNIVFGSGEIKDERIECSVTRVREADEDTMDKYELAEYARDVAECIYGAVGENTGISALNIKYDYDEVGLATVSWSRRMEKMSIFEIANEIKY